MLSSVVLPEPLGPDEAGKLSLLERQVDVIQGDQPAVVHRIGLDQFPGADERRLI